MKKFNKKGFTIVELVVVIAVIAILAAVLIPTFSNVVDKANESKAMQEAKAAYDVWYADVVTTEGFDSSTLNMCITCGDYHFHVVGGQFKTDVVDASATTHTAYTVMGNVAEGALTVSGL